jgi:hypothetical protein
MRSICLAKRHALRFEKNLRYVNENRRRSERHKRFAAEVTVVQKLNQGVCTDGLYSPYFLCLDAKKVTKKNAYVNNLFLKEFANASHFKDNPKPACRQASFHAFVRPTPHIQLRNNLRCAKEKMPTKRAP